MQILGDNNRLESLGTTMFRIITRAGKDASAVRAALERFYSGWGIEVATLRGARRVDDMLAALWEIVDGDPYRLNILLLGREDAGKVAEIEEKAPSTVFVHVVPRSKVRNARLELIAAEIARARAKIRLRTSWSQEKRTYLFSNSGVSLERLSYEPSFEAFFGLGAFPRLVETISGERVGKNPLVVRVHGGTHLVYNGRRVRVELEILGHGLAPRARIASNEVVDVALSSLIEYNKEYIGVLEKTSQQFLKELGSFDTVIVPWSGGKDSTAALLLATSLYGVENVIALYVDTGAEFPATRQYVHDVAEKLGIRLVEVYAGIDKALANGKPLPSHENRWCTGLKIEAIERKVRELAQGRTLLVIGDRDAESPRRSNRPPVRPGPAPNVLAVAPLKLWSGAHVQLYLLSRGIQLNPMYYMGFYRIGCYMCPALRSWEILSLSSDQKTYIRLLKSPIFREFISHRLRKRSLSPSVEAECPVGDICG